MKSVFKENVRLPRSYFDEVNELLEIDNMDEMSDDELIGIGANTQQNETVFEVVFSDGSVLTYDLRSDEESYYDDVWWTAPDESWSVSLEPEWKLGDIEFFIENAHYMVHLEIVPDALYTNMQK